MQKRNQYYLWSIFATFFIIITSCKHTPPKKTEIEDKTFRSIYAVAININKEGKEAASLKYFDSSFANLEDIPPIGRYFRYTFIGMCYNNRSNNEMFNQYADSALLVLEENKLINQYPDEYLHALLEKGHALSNMGTHEKAYDFYLKAKQFGESILNTCSLHELSYDLAMILFKQGRYRESANYFELAFVEATTCINDSVKYGMALPAGYRMQELLDNTGLCFYKMDMPDSALFYYKKTLAFLETNPNFIGTPIMLQTAKAVVLGNMGSVYLKLGNYDLAKKLLKRSIAINSMRGGDFNDAQRSKLKLAELYFEEGSFSLMLQTLNNINSGSDGFSDKELERDYNKQMYRYFEKNENTTESYKFYRNYVSLKDSLESSIKKKYNTDINHYLDLKERQYQINLLIKDNQLNHYYLISAGIFSLLGLTITILLFILYRRNNKQNKLIKKQSIELQKSNLAKDHILKVVAHDLRNPLSGIDYITDSILNDDDSEFPYKDKIQLINSTSRKTLRLINELITINESKIELKIEKKDIAELVRDTVTLMKLIAGKKSQTIITENADTTIFVNIDVEMIGRVLQNLIDNAIKFSPKGERIVVSVQQNRNEVVIKVKDNGIGIPENMLNDILEQITPSKRTGTGGEKSFGLGLSICKKIVTNHNGTIKIESTEGKGSTFYISLPIA